MVTGLAVGVVSVRNVGQQLAVLDACRAAEEGDWQAVLDATRDRVDGSEAGRSAAECRCRALLESGEPDACADLLGRVLAESAAGDWAPSPPLAAHVVNTWRDRGRGLEAAELARRSALAHPEDPHLFYLELLTRSAVEDEEQVLRELVARIPEEGDAAARMRGSLANRHLLRGDATDALSALGESPPPGTEASLGRWFELRGMALASSGDLEGMEATYTEWRRRGGDEHELRARRALTLSIAGVGVAGQTPVEMLRDALDAPQADPALSEALTIRLILTLVTAERIEEALAAYDQGRQRFGLEGLTRAEIERAALHRELSAGSGPRRRGRLRFRVASPSPGAQLAVSPPEAEPLDASYELHPLPKDGVLTLSREIAATPVRWVLRDASGRTHASGLATPRSGSVVDVHIEPRPGRPPQRATLTRRPGDGRRRVHLVLLDCGDWRIIQYLRARGELPVLSTLLSRGHRAVLTSDPPLTAAALEAMVWPTRTGPDTVVGLLHRFGLELAGLASVGENPLRPLEWVLPEASDLFSVIGEGEHAAANLLLAHGGIRSGRHALVSGPRGQRRRVPIATSARDLHPIERVRFPELAAVKRETDMLHLRTIAAELDLAAELAAGDELDLVALRVEPLDILTHAHFARTVADGQDDGAGLLYSVYRYIDARLADVHDALDADDVLVVMSDHGIQTAMEHSRSAFFVADGAGVPAGRAAAAPHLRGVPRLLSDLLGVETGWTDTGIAAWAGHTALARSGAPLHPAPARR